MPFAVNVNAAEANETMRPFLPLAERLGRLFASLVGRAAQACSRCAPRATSPATTPASSTLAVLKGFFGAITDEPVTYVNAPQLAKDHGVEVREVNCATSADFVNLHHAARRRPLVIAARSSGDAASSAS